MEASTTPKPDAGTPPPFRAANIVFVLVDDLSTNLVEYMPNLRGMQEDGMTFTNYVVTDSLCCPSRTSILTGKFPHNSGVFANAGADGGYDTFLKKGNAADTFAVALQSVGYRTSIGGKFLNGYNPSGPNGGAIKGFSQWYLAGNGYPEFGYDLAENGTVRSYGKKPQDYLTDVLAGHGLDFIKAQTEDTPFFIEIATFAPHSPFVPAPRHEGMFPKLRAPRTPRFGVKPSNPPSWLAAIPSLTPQDVAEIDDKFQRRARMVQAVDEMIGNVRAAIASMPPEIADNTYVVFSSDNGFHLGDYDLRGGKMTAFDTDINVPLVVVGPGIAKGSVSHALVENIDLCPTFAELGGAQPPKTVDGRSLVALLHGAKPSDWRDVALVEHHQESRPDDPDLPGANSGDPPDYAAIRGSDFLFVEYLAGGAEYYDRSSDPHELDNRAATLSTAARKRLHDWLSAMRSCKGAAACWAASHAPP